MLNTFKTNFNKAREFNAFLKKGETSKLVMAPVIVEKKEETPAPEKKVEKKPEAKPAEKKEEKPKVEEAKK